MMHRRKFLACVVAAPFAAPWPAAAQVAGKAYRIGYLGQGSKSRELADGGELSNLLQDLRALGYDEGTNLTFDMRFADGRPEALGALAAQLVQTKPEATVVTSVGLAQILIERTRTIPIVALSAGVLEAEPSVRSLAGP